MYDATAIASGYPDVNKRKIAIVGAHHVVHRHLPYVSFNEAAMPFIVKRALRASFEMMLTDSLAVSRATIPVEKAKAAIIVERNRRPNLSVYITFKGRHAWPLRHFELVFEFLEQSF